MARPEDTREIVARWLVEQHAAMLRSARSFADACHAPEDIVSQARVVALDRHAEAAHVTSPIGWLLTITCSVGLQVVRKRNRRTHLRGSGPLRDSGFFQSPDEGVFRRKECDRGAF